MDPYLRQSILQALNYCESEATGPSSDSDIEERARSSAAVSHLGNC
jgi:hypothetical protein